jgi:uncharacterized protein (DUF1778 family)
MYADPKRVRDNRVTLRLDDYEHQLILALAAYQGEQPAALLREMAMREALQVLDMDQSLQHRAA